MDSAAIGIRKQLITLNWWKGGMGGVLNLLGNFMESTIYIFSKSFYLFWMLLELHLYQEFFCILNKIPKIWKVNQLFRWMLSPDSENNLRIFLDHFLLKNVIVYFIISCFRPVTFSFTPPPHTLIIPVQKLKKGIDLRGEE